MPEKQFPIFMSLKHKEISPSETFPFQMFNFRNLVSVSPLCVMCVCVWYSRLLNIRK